MGTTQSSEAPDEFDLSLDVELGPEAIAPAYRKTGSGAFTIFAPRDAEIRAAEWNIVRTGLTFRLPFMLVISVDDHDPLMEVHRTLIDCEHEDELVLQMRHRAPRDSGPAPWHPVRRGDPIARGIVLPIARPEFRLYEAATERV